MSRCGKGNWLCGASCPAHGGKKSPGVVVIAGKEYPVVVPKTSSKGVLAGR